MKFSTSSYFPWFILTGILLLLFMNSQTFTTFAQEPLPTPDPTLTALQFTMEAQQAKIENLQDQITLLEDRFTLVQNQINFDINNKYITAISIFTILSVILGFLSIKSYKELKTLYHDKMHKTLQKNLYRLDPTFLPIFVPSEGFDREIARIKLSGLKNIQHYPSLGDYTCHGVIIVPIATKNDENIFREFLKEYHPKPEKAAYILYSHAQTVRIEPETYDSYLNMTVATNPTALARAILDVGRGLLLE